MKKLLCLAIALMLTFAVVGCSGFTSTVTDFGGEVSSNGGLAVIKGNYVYLINGYVGESADNTFGNVVKGAIIRVKTEDLGKDDVQAEIVVPKLYYSDYYGSGAGLFIAGDYVYFPTTNDKKNSRGEVKYTETVFMKAKLDASETSVIAIADNHEVPYRFYEKGGKVYLTVYVAETDDDGETVHYLVTYDESGNLIKKSEKIEEDYDLGEFGGDCAYYSRTSYNETLEQDESFNEVHRYAYDGSSDVIVLSGVGGYTDKVNGIGTQGATFEILKNAEKALFVSMTYVDTSVVSSTVYFAINHSDIKTEGTAASAKENYDKMTLINDGDSNAEKIFSEVSVYVTANCIVYSDGNFGIVKYDYNDRNTLLEGFSYIFNDSDLKNFTYEYREGNYLYYSDSNAYYYRLDLSSLIDFETGATKADAEPVVERLTYQGTYTSGDWIVPEYIGDYMLYCRNGEPYNAYIYCVDIKGIEEKYDKAISDITDEEIDDYIDLLSGIDKADVEAALKKRIGILSTEDKESIEYYMEISFGD